MQRNDTEDEAKGKDKHDNRIDLQSWGFIRVESYN
jgi:hypothetical protein